jgi:hypothetical protein
MSKFNPDRMSKNKTYMQEYAKTQRAFFDELTVYYWIDDQGNRHEQRKLSDKQMPGGKRLTYAN